MFDYLFESIVIAFTMGAVVGGVVATHLAHRGRKPVLQLLRNDAGKDTLARKVEVRSRD